MNRLHIKSVSNIFSPQLYPDRDELHRRHMHPINLRNPTAPKFQFLHPTSTQKHHHHHHHHKA